MAEVGTLTGVTGQNTVSTNLSLGSWPANSNLYVIFTDDNGSGTPDTSVEIDNFAVTLPFPGIITQPQNSSVSPGQSVTLSVEATGFQPLSYQWRKNSNNVPNQTNATFVINNAQASDAGFYSVIVSNPHGSVTSTSVTVSVNCAAPASFVTTPSDQALQPGGTISLTADTTGTSPVTYQWFKNGSPIANATNATFTQANAQPSDSGRYSVTIDNCAQLPTSAGAVVSISGAPYVIMDLTGQEWRYNQSGACLGAEWRSTTYNDSAWPLGRALLAVENNAALNPLIDTVLALNPGSGQIPTYYFRAQFVLTNDANTVTLLSSNYFDDGAVVYVNGVEAFRYNMSPGDVACNALAVAANPAGEGTFIVSNIPPGLWIQGTNTVAVEVHQNSLNSSDIVFGMHLQVGFLPPTLLTITNQPQSLTVEETKSASFTLGLQGEPAYYQRVQGRGGHPRRDAQSAGDSCRGHE